MLYKAVFFPFSSIRLIFLSFIILHMQMIIRGEIYLFFSTNESFLFPVLCILKKVDEQEMIRNIIWSDEWEVTAATCLICSSALFSLSLPCFLGQRLKEKRKYRDHSLLLRPASFFFLFSFTVIKYANIDFFLLLSFSSTALAFAPLLLRENACTRRTESGHIYIH